MSSANPEIRYKPSTSIPRFSISAIHKSTIIGLLTSWALIKVVRSTPKTRLISFLSGEQRLGTSVLHCRWQS